MNVNSIGMKSFVGTMLAVTAAGCSAGAGDPLAVYKGEADLPKLEACYSAYKDLATWTSGVHSEDGAMRASIADVAQEEAFHRTFANSAQAYGKRLYTLGVALKWQEANPEELPMGAFRDRIHAMNGGATPDALAKLEYTSGSILPMDDADRSKLRAYSATVMAECPSVEEPDYHASLS